VPAPVPTALAAGISIGSAAALRIQDWIFFFAAA